MAGLALSCLRLCQALVALPEAVQARLIKCCVPNRAQHRILLNPVEQRVDRGQRFCPVCETDTAEDEHHFVFDCPEHCAIRERFTAIFWGPAVTLSSFFILHDHKVIAKFPHECFTHRSMLREGVLGVLQHLWLAFIKGVAMHQVVLSWFDHQPAGAALALTFVHLYFISLHCLLIYTLLSSTFTRED